MEKTKELHTELRNEAARAFWLSRRFKSDCELEVWYNGRYLAFKQSAALLEIALGHDEWRRESGISS